MPNKNNQEKNSVKAVGFFCSADGFNEIIVASENVAKKPDSRGGET